MTKSAKNILIFGEIFWDQFQNGARRMGGSALNIAWHLQGLGTRPYFISRIGNDELGKTISQNMRKWGMTTEYLQTDTFHPTGIVKVLLDEDNKATYISPERAALDFIEYDHHFDKFDSDSILYHGSFILRGDESRNTVRKLRDRGVLTFMDFNLRDPYWNQGIIDQWVRDLYVFKLSDEESVHLTKNISMSGREQVEWLQDWMVHKNIKNIIFTLGDKGSFWIQPEEVHFEPARKVAIVNSVGAGDAYVAGILYSQIRGFNIEKAMKYSSLIAAEICKIDSATSTDPEFYRQFPEEI